MYTILGQSSHYVLTLVTYFTQMEDIIYAVDFNFKRDRHLMGAMEALQTIGSEKEKR